ncbi:MAG: IS4 transposase [Cryomorphaceae bacterium]
MTNLDESVSSEDLFEIYSLRWNIEVRFKAWKQSINMKQVFNTVSNYDHQQALIYVALIFQLIMLNIAASLNLGGRVLSLENFSKEIASRFLENTDLEKEICFKFDTRHIIMEKRKRKSLINQLLTT